MFNNRLTQLLMGAIVFLLLADFAKPLLEPVTAFAEGDAKPVLPIISGYGTNAWIYKNNEVYYVRWDTNFKKIQIEGPKALDLDDSDPSAPVVMSGQGNSIWILKGNYVYYVYAVIENNFVTIEVERPEKMP